MCSAACSLSVSSQIVRHSIATRVALVGSNMPVNVVRHRESWPEAGDHRSAARPVAASSLLAAALTALDGHYSFPSWPVGRMAGRVGFPSVGPH
jgi:hypothetical protein